MSKIKDNGLDLYGAESFEQQQFGTAGVEGVNVQRLNELAMLTRYPVPVFDNSLRVILTDWLLF